MFSKILNLPNQLNIYSGIIRDKTKHTLPPCIYQNKWHTNTNRLIVENLRYSKKRGSHFFWKFDLGGVRSPSPFRAPLFSFFGVFKCIIFNEKSRNLSTKFKVKIHQTSSKNSNIKLNKIKINTLHLTRSFIRYDSLVNNMFILFFEILIEYYKFPVSKLYHQ